MYSKNSRSDYNNDRQNGYRSNRSYKSQKNNRPKYINVNIPVSIDGITPTGMEYTPSTLLDFFDSLQKAEVFNKISVPVYARVSTNPNKPNMKYNYIIGFFKGYNDGNADIVIYDKNSAIFNNIKDPVVLPRVSVKNDKVESIIGIDIFSKEDIQNILERSKANNDND